MSTDLRTTNAHSIDLALKFWVVMHSAPCAAWLAWKLWQSCDVIQAPGKYNLHFLLFLGCPTLFFSLCRWVLNHHEDFFYQNVFCQMRVASSQIVSDCFLDENVGQRLEVVRVGQVLLVTGLLLVDQIRLGWFSNKMETFVLSLCEGLNLRLLSFGWSYQSFKNTTTTYHIPEIQALEVRLGNHLVRLHAK